MRVTKEGIEGAFTSLGLADQELVMQIVANFHYRTRKQNEDGSLGEIRITPGELNDAIAYAML